MKKRFLIYLVILIVILPTIVYFGQENTVPTITYFPMDEETSFVKASTRLEMVSEKTNDSYELTWESESKSDKEIYLRQDASILFSNGILRGIRSKWIEGADSIRMKEKLYGEDSSYFQAISYHHGEIHYPDDQIKSIQQITYDQLYVIDSPNTALESFKTPENEYETQWSTLLDHTTHINNYYIRGNC